MYLFFDTETTGKFDFKAPVNAEHQPNICQVGVIVTDEHGKVKSELNALIKPKDWKMDAEAAAVHGITEEDCQRYGITMRGAIEIIRRMAEPVRTIVAHNIDFDVGMFRRECFLQDTEMPFAPDVAQFCTMQETKGLLKLPGRYGDYKFPKLQESYKHFFGKEFEGAHDAMADIRACKDVFFALQNPAPQQDTAFRA